MQKNIALSLRRFGAFIIDCSVWALLVTVLTNLYPVDINEWQESVFIAVLLAGIILLDTISLTWLQTSLGRWLFGIELRKTDGSKVGFVEALQSNLLFWILLGFAASTWIVVIGLAFVLYDYSQHKTWFWDRALSLKVEHKQAGRIKVAVGAVLAVVIILGFWAFSDYDDGLEIPEVILPSDSSSSPTDRDCGIVLLHRGDDCEPRFKGWW